MTKPEPTWTEDEIESLLRFHEEREECEHNDVCEDEFICLTCGKCMREEYMSRAYDRAKDFYRFGE